MSLKRKFECGGDESQVGDDDHEYKKKKFNECSLISKQFREQAINTPVAIYIRRNEHLERIRNLTMPLNITELNLMHVTSNLTVFYDVLDWIFHQPPKHLQKLCTGIIGFLFSVLTIQDEYVEKLCSIPALSTLTSLNLPYYTMTKKGCSFIANCGYFQNLTELSVNVEKGLSDGFLSSPLVLHVKKLDLSYCSIKNLIFPQLMPLLEDLNLEGNDLESNDLVALTQTRNLTRLDLSYNVNWDDEQCKTISENQYLTKLTDLELNFVDITPKGLKYIVTSPYFKQLKCLHMNYFLDKEGCKILAESENMRNLTSLTLGKELDEFLTLDGLSDIFNSNNLSNLQSLFLKGLNLIDSNFGVMLATSSFRKNLKSLKLVYCDLDILGVQYTVSP